MLQLVVASSMILGHLPPVLRSLHEATGVGIWIAAFVLAYLARIASGELASRYGAERSPRESAPSAARVAAGLATRARAAEPSR